MKKPTKTMRILITVQVLEDDTPDPTPQAAPDEAQTDLSRFARLEDLPAPTAPPTAPPAPPAPTTRRNPPTYADGRAQHPSGADRAEHARYGTGRKVHRCSNCGAPNRRFNPKTGACGLGPLRCDPYIPLHGDDSPEVV